VAEFLRQLFSFGPYMPHGGCYLWQPALVWLRAIADGLIALAYATIPVAWIYITHKRGGLPFHWMFLCFGTIIAACGAIHGMELWNLWHADTWLAGGIKAITAPAWLPTAGLLFLLVPQARALPHPDKLLEAHRALELQAALLQEQAALLELAQDSIIVRDMRNAIQFWNHGAEVQYGWAKAEALGKISYTLLRTEFPEPLEDIEATLLRTGRWEGELTQSRRDGSQVSVASRWVLRRDTAGRPDGILEINNDVTARKKAEKRFQQLLEAAPDAMVIVGDRGHIELVNAQAEKLFGYPRAELLGQSIELLIPARFHGRHAAHRSGYFRDPRVRPMEAGLELYGQRKDGTEFPVEVSLSPLQTEQGTLVTSAIRDTTGRKQVEAKIQELNRDLNRRAIEQEAINRELEAFTYSVSHDLRAPLRHLAGFSRILLEEHAAALDPQGRHYLERVSEAALQMGRLVDDLLNLSRVGRSELARQLTDLNGLVEEVRSQSQAEIASRQVEWKIGKLPAVACDPGLLKLVFANLLSNALKFTRGREPALIELGQTICDEGRAIYIRDNGVGFDMKYSNKLFGVFQRLHRDEDFEGTGIGLATVQRIIHKHGGRVWAEARPGQGATFYFTLSAAPQPGPDDSSAHRGVAWQSTQ
jgi:PAS domain S-box-containing protein